MRKIFITGAAGFIGSQLAYYFWKKGDQVTLLDNFSYGSEDNLVFSNHDFRNEIIRGDIRDRELINQIFEKHQFDYVYHIAAITPLPDCQMNPSEASDVNVTGTVTILEASRIYGVKKVAFVREEKFEDVKNALMEIEVNGLTVSQVMGCGLQRGYKEIVRGMEVEPQMQPKVKFEIVVSSEEWAEKTIEAIKKAAYTGEFGDGKIFSYPVASATKIRTGETGYDAVQCQE